MPIPPEDRLAKARAARKEGKKEREIPLSPAQKAHLRDLAQHVPPRFRDRYLKVVLGTSNSRTLALQMKCGECVGFEDTTAAVRACSSISCPLWIFRPYQATDADEELGDPGEENADG